MEGLASSGGGSQEKQVLEMVVEHLEDLTEGIVHEISGLNAAVFSKQGTEGFNSCESEIEPSSCAGHANVRDGL